MVNAVDGLKKISYSTTTFTPVEKHIVEQQPAPVEAATELNAAKVMVTLTQTVIWLEVQVGQLLIQSLSS
jgi:hypothetical protein